MNTMRWYFRRLRSELLLIAFGLFSLIVAPLSVQAESLHQVCQAPVPTDTPSYPQGVAAGDPAFFAEQTLTGYYYYPQSLANLGFDYLVPMINATSVYDCDRKKGARIGIKAIRAYRVEPTTASLIEVQRITFGNGYDRPNGLRSGIWYRQPGFFTSGQPSEQPVLESIGQQTYTVDLSSIPLGIYHAWGNPRVKAVAGAQYKIEVIFWAEGDACLQVGLDFWKGPTSPYTGWSDDGSTNNIQVALSDWYCGKRKQVTVMLPKN